MSGSCPEKEQISYLLKSETFLLQQWLHEVVELIATVVELSLAWVQLSFVVALIAHDITDIRQSDKHSGAVLVTQSTLDAVLRKGLFGILQEFFTSSESLYIRYSLFIVIPFCFYFMCSLA